MEMPISYSIYFKIQKKILYGNIKNDVRKIISPELQNKWDKAFRARGYYVETIGNITDEAVQKYIKEQAEESRKEDSRSTAL
jgi:REP element-mobilizing transposase RayT